MLEKDLERKIVRHCHDLGILAYKFTSPAHRGVPDRLLVGNGRVMFMELKKKGGRLTSLQERELERLTSKGMKAVWCDDFGVAKQMIHEHFFDVSFEKLEAVAKVIDAFDKANVI